MSWLAVILIALSGFAAMVWLLKVPRAGWTVIAIALLLGLGGYGLQARPDLPGAPKPAAERMAADPTASVVARQALAGREGMSGNRWLVIADALSRHGQYGDAAQVLLGAVEKQPKDAEAWLAMANALVDHSEGTLSPASLYAFRQAADAAPGHPGPPFFLGLALARSGRLAEARQMWAQLLAAAPADTPWRQDLADRLARLDEFIARQAGPPSP